MAVLQQLLMVTLIRDHEASTQVKDVLVRHDTPHRHQVCICVTIKGHFAVLGLVLSC